MRYISIQQERGLHILKSNQKNMYTAKIKSKEFVNGALKVTVDYSDGVKTVQETCIPQDEDGFKFWVKSRLATFNSAETINATYAEDSVVDVSDKEVEVIAPTAEVVARNTWLKLYYKWLKVKTTLIDTGILVGDETKVVQLKNKVKEDLLPEYLDYI